MSVSKCLLILLLLASFGCSAQEPPAQSDAQLKQRIERQLRERFRIPSQVQLSVGSVQPSEFAGYDAINATLSGAGDQQVLNFLISKDRKTLIRLTKIDITKDPYVEVMDKIDLKGRAVRGNKDAKVTIVNYDDFQCPYCAEMHTNLQEAARQFGDQVRVVYKDFPLPFHRWAARAAVDANCLAQLNGNAYWAFADTVHARSAQIPNAETGFSQVDRIALDTGTKFSVDSSALQRCIEQQPDAMLKQSTAEGESLGVDGTPTVFINGERMPGLVSEEQLVAVIKKHLAEQNGQTGSDK